MVAASTGVALGRPQSLPSQVGVEPTQRVGVGAYGNDDVAELGAGALVGLDEDRHLRRLEARVEADEAEEARDNAGDHPGAALTRPPVHRRQNSEHGWK